MKEKIRIHEMDDREYRRYQLLRKKRLEARNKTIIFAFIFCFMFVLSFLFRTTYSSANHAEEMKYKYFKVISVGCDDTLWDIAGQYMDSSIYSSKKAYIDEVVRINGLKDASVVKNGQKITVPYYSTEFIQ